jgi:hypothetical protein
MRFTGGKIQAEGTRTKKGICPRVDDKRRAVWRGRA